MKVSKLVPVLVAIAFFLGSSLTEGSFAKGHGGGSRSIHTSYRSSSSHSRSSYRTPRSSYSSKASSGHSRSTYQSHSSGHSRQSYSHGRSYNSYTGHNKNYSSVAARDSHGRIKRSEKAKHDFQRHNPCPSTGGSAGSCPGYVIDHIKPLKRGGADSPSNMQWQTKAAAKAKDKWE